MFLERLEITDFGGHKHLLLDKLGPVVGLLGPNGSGKSTVLYALEYLIRGTLALDQKTPMEALVRNWGSPEGASNAVVEGEWRNQGNRWVLSRQFGKTSKRKLKCVDGPLLGKEYVKADIVERVLAEMFGSDLQLSGPAVFLKQGSLHKMLFGSDAEREELFVKLLNVQQVVKLVEVIDECRTRQLAGIQDLTQAIDDARVAWERAETERRDQSELYNKIPDFSADIRALAELDEARSHLNRTVSSAMATIGDLRQAEEVYQRLQIDHGTTPWQDLATDIEQLVAQKVHYAQALQQDVQDQGLRRQLQTASQELETVVKAIADNSTGISGRQLMLTRLPDLAVLNEQIYTLTSRLQVYPLWRNVKVMMQGLLDNPFRETEPEFQEQKLTAEIQKLDQDAGVLQEAVKVLGSLPADACACTVCGSPRAHWTRSIESATSALAMLKARQVEVADELKRQRLNHVAWQHGKERYEYSLIAHTNDFHKQNALYPWAVDFNFDLESTTMETLVAQRDQVLKLQREKESMTQALGQDQVRKQSLEQQIEELTRSLEDRPERDMTAVRALHADCEDKIARTRNSMQLLKDGDERVRARIIELQAKNQARESAKLNEQQVLDKMSDTAQSFLGKHQQDVSLAIQELRGRQQVRDEAAGAVNSAARVATESQSRLELLEQSRSRNAAKQSLGNSLQTLRQVFTRQGLPMTYVNYRFRRLALVTASYMQDIDTDMKIAVDDERSCAFKFRRRNTPEGLWFQQERMSGGQRVRLCVAFSFAMQRLILPKLGFLTLDEPSTHLDEKYVPMLAELLSSIGTRLENTGSQIWITDHHRELTSAFSNVVTFAPLEDS